MGEFTKALDFVLVNEGGFVDNPNDSGGATLAGLSLRFLRELPAETLKKYGIFHVGNELTVADLKALTPTQINNVYYGEFWEPSGCEKIAFQDVANYVFDCCVNHGIAEGIKLLQRAMWAYAQKKQVVQDDGVLGSQTLGLIDHVSMPSFLVSVLMAERAGLMRLIASQQTKDKEFLNGWLSRCYRI